MLSTQDQAGKAVLVGIVGKIWISVFSPSDTSFFDFWETGLYFPKVMSRKPRKVELEMFECRERVRPVLEEYFDSWMIVGERAGKKAKIIIGVNHGGWKGMQPVYDAAKKWQDKTKPIEHFKE